MNPITIRIALTLAALGYGLIAQAGETHPLFAKAVLIEESECDPEGALELFQQVAVDESLPAALRDRAWLRAGRCLRKLGRIEEAKAAFEKAAAGEGDVAKQARAALRGEDPVEIIRLEARVQTALSDLSHKKSNARDRLLWMGPLAAPHLAAALEGGIASGLSSLEFVQEASSILLTIGGPYAERFLRSVVHSKDPLLQRAVLEALASVRKTPELLAVGKAFLQDPVPQVRLVAYKALRRSGLSMDEAFALAEDADPDVAATVLGYLRGWKSAFEHGDDETAEVAALFALVRRALERPELEVRFAAVRFVGMWLQYEAGRSYFFDTLPRPDLAEQFRRVEQEFHGIHLDMPRELPVASSSARAVAEKLGPIEPRPVSHRAGVRHEALAKVLERAIATWDHAALEDVIALAALGYDGDLGLRGRLTKWAVQTARPEDATALVNALGSWGQPEKVLEWLGEKGLSAETLPPIAPLREWMRERMARTPAALLAKDKTFLTAVETLARIPSREALICLEEILDRAPEFAMPALQAVCGRSDPGVADALMRFFLRKGSSEAEQQLRSVAWARLCDLGHREALSHLPAAYEAGMSSCRLWRQRQASGLGSRRGLGWLLADFDQRSGVIRLSRLEDQTARLRFTESDLRATFEACLDLDLEEAVWEDVLTIARSWEQATRGGRPGGVGTGTESCLFSPAVFATLASRAPDCPLPELKAQLIAALLEVQSPAADPAREALAARLLATEDPKLQRQALDALRVVPDPETGARIRGFLEAEDPDLVRIAMRILSRTKDPTAVPDLIPLLRHDEMLVRRDALGVIAGLVPERAVELCLPLLADPMPDVRAAVCVIFQTKLDRRAVPELIDALKDEDKGVRKEAMTALSLIRMWADEHARWKRLLEGGGLDSPNAAEALIKQAGPDSEKKIRIAAIHSLGTLAVPETLPFLIKLMADEDPEIAAAAEAAVAKINSRDGAR